MPTPEEIAAEAKVAEEAKSAAQAETVKAVANAVRESLGFKEGERFDEKIRSAAANSVSHALGLEDGQSVKDMLSGMLKDHKPPDPEPTTEKAIAAAQLKAVTEAVGGVKQELSDARATAAKEKRNGLVRDALGEFPIDDAYKGVLNRGFISGAEAEPVLSPDGTSLVIKTDDGQSVDFEDFLSQYFESNKQFLKEELEVGSDARGGDGKPPKNGVFQYDHKKRMEDGGKALREEMAKNPDGAAERQAEIGKTTNKIVDDFFAKR